jgi:hypothetical protein
MQSIAGTSTYSFFKTQFSCEQTMMFFLRSDTGLNMRLSSGILFGVRWLFAIFLMAFFGPSTVLLSQWVGTLNYNVEPDKNRVATASACTRLNFASSSNPTTFTVPGSTLCTNQDIVASFEVIESGCDRYLLRVSLENTHPLNQYRVGGFKLGFTIFSNEFTSDGLEILDPGLLNGFANWPWPYDGTESSCGGLECGGANQNYCFNTAGHLFQYCFQSPNATSTEFLAGGQIIYMDIPIRHAPGACLHHVAISSLSISYITFANGSPVINAGCLPPFNSTSSQLPFCPSLAPLQDLTGEILFAGAQGVEDVKVKVTGNCGATCTLPELTTNMMGAYSYCGICPSCTEITIKPELDIDQLNGVNTYDLVLISRHILGLEPLNTPYKLISADANKTNTVTTFDIVEIRKLILGTYQKLPNNTSWRFVDQNQVFPNPDDPFAGTIREDISFTSWPQTNVDFVGCKIGDIDNTATPNNRPNRPVQGIVWEVEQAKGSKVITLPIRYTGTAPLEALQFALRFDPNLFELISPSSGELEGVEAAHFGLSQASAGNIGFSWNLMDPTLQQALQPGQVLFYLTLRAKGTVPDNAAILDLASDVVPDGAWAADGTEYSLAGEQRGTEMRQATTNAAANSVSVAPNQTTDMARLSIQSARAGKASFVLTDAFGQTLAFRETTFGKGGQQLDIPELAQQPAGVYTYWLKLPNGEVFNGRIVKL